MKKVFLFSFVALVALVVSFFVGTEFAVMVAFAPIAVVVPDSLKKAAEKASAKSVQFPIENGLFQCAFALDSNGAIRTKKTKKSEAALVQFSQTLNIGGEAVQQPVFGSLGTVFVTAETLQYASEQQAQSGFFYVKSENGWARITTDFDAAFAALDVIEADGENNAPETGDEETDEEREAREAAELAVALAEAKAKQAAAKKPK